MVIERKNINLTEILLTNYPLIRQLRNSKSKYSVISQILNDEYNISVTSQQLINFLIKVERNKYHPEYDSLLILSYDLTTDIKLNSVDFHALVILEKEIMDMVPKNNYEPYIVDRHNLIDLPNQISMLYAKRFLNLYEIPDELLIQQQKESNPKIEMTELKQLQDNIHRNIKQESKEIITNIKSKYVKFLTNNLLRKYQ